MSIGKLNREELTEALRPLVDQFLNVLFEHLDGSATKNPGTSVNMLTTREAAELIGARKSTLDQWRSTQRDGGPPYHKIGKTVRYKRSELDAWLADNLVSR